VSLRLGLVLIALAASGETIRFTPATNAVIEKRLAAVQAANADREHTLHAMFDEAGCSGVHLVEQTVKGSKIPNVICALEGSLDSAIIVGAHFDHVKRGDGVVDNWSGASLLPSLYESLKAAPRRHNFVFVGFTDEELGLFGSRYYLHELSKQDIRKISAMVNMDSLGTGTTKLETDRGDKRLAKALADVAATFKLPLSVVNAHQVGRSDSDSFQDKKVPSINIHSLTQETFPILHTERDRMDAIQLAEYFDSYRLIAAYLAYLDQSLDPAE
jgi:Zn-dependent M28 family amino/carboxypeptidase